MEAETKVQVPITKIYTDRQLVFGWASIIENADGTVVTDFDNDIIDQLELENAVYMYVRDSGIATEGHEYYYAGRLVESIVFTKEKMECMGIPAGTLPIGWWIGIYVYDKMLWNDIKNGKYKMFSIGARATREEVPETP